MIVIVETNFIIELALEQAEAEHVECYARDLKGAASYFVTKDKDFEHARGLLEAHRCRLITGFGAAFGAIRERTDQ